MLVHWIWLATRPGLNKRIQYALLRHFGDPEAVFGASPEALTSVPGMTPKALDALSQRSLDQAQDILNQCRRNEIRLLTMQDPGYPRRLLGIYDPPILLYYRGSLPNWEVQPIIGAVGTRRYSEYGIRSAEKLGYQLTCCGGCVASGMAEGIDAAVLTGVLSAQGTPVVFLAGGVDMIYPAENRNLYFEILSRGGGILSEQPPGVKPTKWRFPVRNRLISGISNAVLVVEAPEQSGALITARHAMEQGREVYAVPGPIDAVSARGSNALLKDGAHMVQSGWDILEQYQALYEGVENRLMEPMEQNEGKKTGIYRGKTARISSKEKKVIDNGENLPYSDVEKSAPQLSDEEKLVVAQLKQGRRLRDDVIAEAALPAGQVSALLTMLEIKGVVKRLPGNMLELK